jgi:hypothetical protein
MSEGCIQEQEENAVQDKKYFLVQPEIREHFRSVIMMYSEADMSPALKN